MSDNAPLVRPSLYKAGGASEGTYLSKQEQVQNDKCSKLVMWVGTSQQQNPDGLNICVCTQELREVETHDNAQHAIVE